MNIRIGEYVKITDNLEGCEWYHKLPMKVVDIKKSCYLFVNFDFKKMKYISDKIALENVKSFKEDLNIGDIFEISKFDTHIHITCVVSDVET